MTTLTNQNKTPETTTAEKQKTINIKRTLNLPLNTVWKAWTEPESFKKWWGPKEYTCPDCTIDFKIGGKFLASMQGIDGKKIWSTGTYKEIIPQKKIVVTDSFADSKGNIVPASDYKMPGEMALELLVTITFEEVDGKTNMSLQHEGLAVEMADDCIKGWQSSFDKMETNSKQLKKMKNEFWINLPVKDLKKSKDFFTQLGFGIKEMPGNPTNIVILLAGEKEVAINLFEEKEFKGYSENEISETNNATEALFNIGAENKEEVNEFAEKVKKAGGKIYRAPTEKDGWMYGCGFTDLDGHRWSMLYMDMSKMPK